MLCTATSSAVLHVCCTGFLIMGTRNRLDSLKVAGCGGHGICLDGNTKQCSYNVIAGCSVKDNVSCHLTCPSPARGA